MEVVTLSVRLPKPMHEQLRVEAFKKRTTMNALIVKALGVRNAKP